MNLSLNTNNQIFVDDHFARASIGKNGIGKKVLEGDCITPVGRFSLRCLMYRADRYPPPKTQLHVEEIQKTDGWCNDPEDPNYNKKIKLPFPKSHEVMWRQDHVYDFVIPLGFNDEIIIPGAGSAIFIHLAHPDFKPTEGCVGVEILTMKKIFQSYQVGDCIDIGYVKS